MRRIAAALAVSLLAVATFAVPSVGAVTSAQPKVVIIVGPVGSVTDYYLSDAEAAYTAALRYTSNVVRVYTPTATWDAANAALQGASIVIYMGHGNGYPSPYTSTLMTDRQDGLGLNPSAGTDNTTTRYYGESFLASSVRLAPNAVVMLFHLCYASGNSEEGLPAPTLAVAQQRVDNMAAGWLQTGARAVVAEGHFSPAWYIDQLFSTHQTIDQVWRSSPTFNARDFAFPSVRTAGATAEMDPDGTPNGYWRALTGWLDLTTDAIIGGGSGTAPGPTSGDPAAFVVPGAASVNVDTAGLYPDATLSANPATGTQDASLPRDTRLRLLARAGTTAAGSPIFQVTTLDGSRAGWMSGADLLPRDSTAPVLIGVDAGSAAFSPNGDGRNDTLQITARISKPANWTVRFENPAGRELGLTAGVGDTIAASWSGIVNGSVVPDGVYRYVLSAHDDWGNPEARLAGSVVVDTVAPALTGPTPALASSGQPVPLTLSPNGDRSGDTVVLADTLSEPGYVDVTVVDGAGAVVRSYSVGASTRSSTLTWDGTSDVGTTVPDGLYTIRLTPRDRAGNIGQTRDRSLVVYRALGWVSSSTSVFYPQDLDALAPTARLSFSLSDSATVTWTIRDAAGATVLTKYAARLLPSGRYTFDWDGRLADGTMAPVGRYTSWVSATNGSLSATGQADVVAGAFLFRPSTTTPVRGQLLRLVAISPEPLAGPLRVTVQQPGLRPWVATLSKIGTSAYRVFLRLRTGGRPGVVRLTLVGTDVAGGSNQASVDLTLR